MTGYDNRFHPNQIDACMEIEGINSAQYHGEAITVVQVLLIKVAFLVGVFRDLARVENRRPLHCRNLERRIIF